MKWLLNRQSVSGLTQGLLGRKRAALTPSASALGPNVYLSEQDFLKMLGAALAVHLVIFVIAGLFPDEKVTNIPVRALSFKLGDQDRPPAYGNAPERVIAAPVMTATNADMWQPSREIAPVIPAPLKPMVAPAPRPAKQAKVYTVTDPVPHPVAPAVAPSPQQYVREVGAPSPQMVAALAGVPDGVPGSEATTQAVRARYEQEISSWILRHKYYPAAASGREGRAVVRVRIDRAGNVRYYAIEVSTGTAALDAAALDMIRRANPVPAVPPTYPEGNLVEFLIPISFTAPQ
ncbi:MAG: TonB family protein [Pseudomonadota bacterium]